MNMLNYIWGGMILISTVVSFFTGRTAETAAAAISGAADAVDNCILLLGIMCFWTGIAKIGERAGAIKIFSKIMRPLTKRIFPRLDPDGKAMEAIVFNIAANMFGMGNAATPLGIKAVKELEKLNGGDINRKTCKSAVNDKNIGKSTIKYSEENRKSIKSASDEMCMFAVINTASVQIIPSTLISLRQSFGSQSPTEVILPVWAVSICALCMGVATAKFFERRSRL